MEYYIAIKKKQITDTFYNTEKSQIYYTKLKESDSKVTYSMSPFTCPSGKGITIET